MKDVNTRAKSIKLLEETIGINLHDPELGNDFLGIQIQNAQAKKDKMDEIYVIKIKTSHFKIYHQESRKTTFKMGENLCNSYM